MIDTRHLLMPRAMLIDAPACWWAIWVIDAIVVRWLIISIYLFWCLHIALPVIRAVSLPPLALSLHRHASAAAMPPLWYYILWCFRQIEHTLRRGYAATLGCASYAIRVLLTYGLLSLLSLLSRLAYHAADDDIAAYTPGNAASRLCACLIAASWYPPTTTTFVLTPAAYITIEAVGRAFLSLGASNTLRCSIRW